MSSIINIKNYDELRQLSLSNSFYDGIVFVSGDFINKTDGIKGFFQWQAGSIEPDNQGTVIRPNSIGMNGRWHRIYDDEISVNWFGAKPDGRYISELNIENDSNQIEWINGLFSELDIGKTIIIDTPSELISGTITISGYELRGIGTKFKTELFEGQSIVIQTNSINNKEQNTRLEVYEIINDSLLRVNSALDTVATTVKLYKSTKLDASIIGFDKSSKKVTLNKIIPGKFGIKKKCFAYYGTDNSDAIQKSENYAGLKGGDIRFSSGIYLFSKTIKRRSGTNWLCHRGTLPYHTSTYKGTYLVWSGKASATGIEYISEISNGVERGLVYTQTHGIMLDGNDILQYGILIDSKPGFENTGHHFYKLTIANCWDCICVGTSAGNGYQSDGILIQDCVFKDWSRAAIELNSQNAFQNSKIERGSMVQFKPDSVSSFIRLSFSPNNFIIEGVAASGKNNFKGAFIDIRYPRSSGGQYFMVSSCGTEIENAYAVRTFTNLEQSIGGDYSGGGVILINNSWEKANININDRLQVVSIGNRGYGKWIANGGVLCNVRSMGDIVSIKSEQGWHLNNSATLWGDYNNLL